MKYTPPNQDGLLQFHIRFTSKAELEVFLELRPGCEKTRQIIYDHAKEHPPIFKNGSKKLPSKWCRLHFKRLISKKDLESQPMMVLEQGIRQQLDTFITEDLKKICALIKDIESIWDKNAPFADQGVQIDEDAMNEEDSSQFDEETS